MASLKKTLLAKSSSGGSYYVQFLLDDTSARVFCHCPAGETQMMCKHKIALIKGDVAMLFDAKETADLTEILAWPSFAKVKERLARYETELSAIERDKAILTKREKELKSAFSKALTFGL